MEYDKLRYYFFTQSYIASRIVNYLRDKYLIPSNISSSDWVNLLLKKHMNIYLELSKEIEDNLGLPMSGNISPTLFWYPNEVEKKLMPEIPKLAQKFNIDEKLFRVFVIFNNVPNKLAPPNKIFYVNPGKPLKEEGIYIKIEDDTTTRELQNQFKDVRNFQSLYNKVAKKYKKQPASKYKKIRRKTIAKGDTFKGEVYTRIEENIIKIVDEINKNNGNKYLKEELFSNEVVSLAIENAVDDYMSSEGKTEKEIDNGLSQMSKKFSIYYYDIIERYKLPTYRDWSLISRLM